MSYGIVRVQKMSSGSVKGIEIHDRREKDGISHTNQDIDWSLSNQNYDLHPAQNESFTRAVKERIIELDLPRAMRKDAIVLAQVLVTSDHGYFENKSPEQIKEFFEDSYKFLMERYGKENTISATVHMDERTPHMHFNFVPVTTDGRLSAKSILTRQSLIEQQDMFFSEVGKKHGLDRGERGGKKKHLEVADYKALTATQRAQEIERQVDTLKEQKNALQGQLAVLEKKVEVKGYYIKAFNEIPKGKKTLLGKVEFTKQEASSLIETCKTVYDARSTAQKAIDNAEQMKAYVSRVQASVSSQAVDRLKEEAQELTQEVAKLKGELRAADKVIERVNKVFEKHPDIADRFFKAEKEIEKALHRGMDIGFSR